jgi:hypothetical protein
MEEKMSRTMLLTAAITAVLASSSTAVITQTINPGPAGAAGATVPPNTKKAVTTDVRVRHIEAEVLDKNHGLAALGKDIYSIKASTSAIYDGQRLSLQVVRIYQCIIQRLRCG